MEKNHYEQARLWLDGAKDTADNGREGSDKYAVATAMAIHAILKANDALTTKFLGKTAKRHDEARKLFDELVKKQCINAEYAGYNQILQDAINNKSKAEYKISFFSKKSYEDLARKAEKFMEMVKRQLE